jgi:hypothetical protein
VETIIRVTPSELNEKLLEQIRRFIDGKDNVDITVSLKEYNREYVGALEHSIEEAENEDGLVTFSMEDFMAYSPNH